MSDARSPKKIRNMEEFAQASGISRPTVSKYFNDPESVKPVTRERIEKALKAFDYHPNMFAINLNRKRPKNIGIVVPHVADPFYAEVVRQIEMRCLDAGYWAVILSSHGERALEARAIQILLSMKIAGAIVAPLGFKSDLALIDSLSANIPLVFLDSRVDGDGPFVGTDNVQSVSLMVDYLHRTGESPCFLALPRVNRNATERSFAYVAAMERLGLEPHLIDVPGEDWNFEEAGYRIALDMLDGGGFPSRTVMCANDRIAFGVIAAACRRGLRVGHGPDADLRVAGHDDHPLSRFACPALTTVAQDFDGLARRSVDQLLGMIEGGPAAGGGLLEARLVMRDSA